MKKIFIILLCIVFILSAFASCDQAEESKTEISEGERVSETASQTESELSADISEEISILPPEESTNDESEPDESVPEASLPNEENIPEASQTESEANTSSEGIKSITQPLQYYPEKLEFFFEDDEYMYIFDVVCSEFTTVEYYDGSKQNVTEALESGNITISDLDKFRILYYKSPVLNTSIPEGRFIISDYSHLHGELWGDSIDDFYEDDSYSYYYGQYNKSAYMIVTYSDGTRENIKEALEKGNITIEDLDKFNIKYCKKPK